MQHKITIVQTIATTVEVYATSSEEAIDIGNHLVANNMIPIDGYDMLDANVTAEIENNIVPFPVKKSALYKEI